MRQIGREIGLLSVALAIVSLMAGGASAARAAQKPDAAYAACLAKASSTRDMQDCQQADFAAVAHRLNAALARALAALPPDQQAKLREAQRRWIAFRTSDCQVFYGKESGTIATVQGGDCMIGRTEDRIKDLQTFVNQGK